MCVQTAAHALLGTISCSQPCTLFSSATHFRSPDSPQAQCLAQVGRGTPPLLPARTGSARSERRLPGFVGLRSLTCLSSLQLSRNELRHGWQHLRPLSQQLKLLNLRCCGLAEVPQELSVLVALSSLHLEGNHLRGGRQHLPPLRHLQFLDLSWCQLAEVPQDLSCLAALSSLSLSTNSSLGHGWQRMRPQQQLQKLDLSLCSLPELPRELSALTRLSSLNRGYNSRLTGGWQHLLRLQLRKLNLHSCRGTGARGAGLPDGPVECKPQLDSAGRRLAAPAAAGSAAGSGLVSMWHSSGARGAVISSHRAFQARPFLQRAAEGRLAAPAAAAAAEGAVSQQL